MMDENSVWCGFYIFIEMIFIEMICLALTSICGMWASLCAQWLYCGGRRMQQLHRMPVPDKLLVHVDIGIWTSIS